MTVQVIPKPRIDPLEQAVALTRSAVAALRYGDRIRADYLLRAALRLEPGLGEAWLWLGTLQQGARRSICLRWARLTLPDATIPALDSYVRPPNRTPARRSRSLRLMATSITAAGLIILSSLELAYANRIYPGTVVLGRSVSGQTSAQAVAALEPVVARWAAMPMVLQAGKARWSVSLGQLGHFEVLRLVQRAYVTGRSGTMLEQLTDRSLGLLDPVGAAVTPVLDEQALAALHPKLAGLIERPAQPAQFVRRAGRWTVRRQVPGIRLDWEAAQTAIRAAWQRHMWHGPPTPIILNLPLQHVEPEQTAEQLLPLLPALERQTAQPLELTWKDGSRLVDPATLLDLARLPPRGDAFSIDKAAVRGLVSSLAAEINRPMRPSHLVRDNFRVRSFQLGRAGRKLDAESAFRQVMAALERGDRSVTLSVQYIEPPPGEAEQLGLMAVLSEGRSNFASHSSPDRDQNVLIAGRQFDGLLVPPGGIVSANQMIGSITWEKGYRWGDMIGNAGLIRTLGGGVCQVSTTFFRAAFWSGLEILERHNHSWRLAWYEVDAPAGMDAAILLGSLDLKVRNNTGHYLLIRVTTDLEQKTQRFTIYGTPTDWKVKMIGPHQHGRTIVIERQVLNDQQVVLSDRFTSYYSR